MREQSQSLNDPSVDDGEPIVVHGRRRLTRRARIAIIAFAVVGALVAGFALYAGLQYTSFISGLKRSLSIAGPKSQHGDTNILVMGLDSRVDENGKPLPKALYDALHAGDASNGGLNSNVLMLLHIPGDGHAATAISIPRDDYAALAGCPDGECMGKIKQAYGLAFDQATRQLVQQGVNGNAREQRARDAGRAAEIATVRQFLGVPIDHFIEVTMVAFFQISQVVQPITVCVKEDTQDSYSGAKFHAGNQEISAEQALAFVRQRRDNVHPDLNFTDLDRSRRQQAFIASLFHQLKQADTFANPLKINGILDVAKKNTAIDKDLDILSLVGDAEQLSGGNLHFFTLPIRSFGTDPRGESVNLVDLNLIHSTVHSLLYGASAKPAPKATTTTPAAPAPSHVVVNVVNASGRSGAAHALITALVAKGYVGGAPSTGAPMSSSVIDYAAGGEAAARALAASLGGMATRVRAGVAPGTLRVVLGSDYTPTPQGTATTASAPAKAVAATGGGRSGPPPTALTDLSGNGIPCVK
ncbi:MAG TPA: LCP family protein [Pedococcus sp.]|nr:LCP family protein [Pedococcus sp.]